MPFSLKHIGDRHQKYQSRKSDGRWRVLIDYGIVAFLLPGECLKVRDVQGHLAHGVIFLAPILSDQSRW